MKATGGDRDIYGKPSAESQDFGAEERILTDTKMVGEIEVE